jgi:hypothetical protein
MSVNDPNSAVGFDNEDIDVVSGSDQISTLMVGSIYDGFDVNYRRLPHYHAVTHDFNFAAAV